MVQSTLHEKTFQDKISKLLNLDYGSKTPSQNIEMKKRFLVYKILLKWKKKI